MQKRIFLYKLVHTFYYNAEPLKTQAASTSASRAQARKRALLDLTEEVNICLKILFEKFYVQFMVNPFNVKFLFVFVL